MPKKRCIGSTSCAPYAFPTPFYIWIGMSVALAGLQIGLPWAFYDKLALEKQLIAQAMIGGLIELR